MATNILMDEMCTIEARSRESDSLVESVSTQLIWIWAMFFGGFKCLNISAN